MDSGIRVLERLPSFVAVTDGDSLHVTKTILHDGFPNQQTTSHCQLTKWISLKLQRAI